MFGAQQEDRHFTTGDALFRTEAQRAGGAPLCVILEPLLVDAVVPVLHPDVLDGHTFKNGPLIVDIYAGLVGTIITMATIYGTELGFGQTTLIGTLLMVQFLAAPFAFFFGWLSRKIGTKKGIYITLVVYTLIAIAGYFLYQEWQFWLLGAAVATVQGGSQALSRSLIGKMMPKSKSAEFYGFFSVFEKFASILGPFIFGVISRLMNESRLSIGSLIVFFLVGIFVLTKVNIPRGEQVAREEEMKMVEIG